MKVTEAVIQTKAGKLAGECIDGVCRFLGVCYAQSTEGENRFLPPQPLIPWEGVKPAKEFAPISWQTDTPRMEDKEVTETNIPELYAKAISGNTDVASLTQSEDCLALNVWTAGLRDGAKRPIMVWFHGGGYIAGGAPGDWHDGYNLAKKQNVVLAAVGHRLGVFGYLYLGGFDDKYKASANLGHQDMAAALRWLKDNAEELGGDPDNIMIFGQSGGGGKVASLMAMPMAKGLFQKAVIQSGGFGGGTPEAGTEMAKQLLDHLGIAPDHVDDLKKIPAEKLIAATREINAKRTQGNYFVCNPIMDGTIMAYDPFDGAEGSEFSKDVVLMTGCTNDDAKLNALFNPPVFKYTFGELPDRIMELGYTKEEAEELIDIYRRALPEDSTASDYYTSLLNDKKNLEAAASRSAARAKVGAAPTYTFVFCNRCNNPDFKAIHGVDVPFVFDNYLYAPEMWNANNRTGAEKLSEAAGAAWASFARSGNPSNALMPTWKPYDEVNRYTMLMDYECRLVSDYRQESRLFFEKKAKK